MMTLTKQPETMPELPQLTELDTPTLRAELTDALSQDFARRLIRIAAIWAELERRGEDLSSLRTGIGTYLPAIAAGTVTPEAVVAFAGRESVLRKIATLPPDEQRRLAAGGTVLLVVGSESGYTHRMVPLAALPARSVNQVFGERCIRSESAQIAMLSAPPAAMKRSGRVKRGNVVVDRKAAIVKVGSATATIEDVLAALRAAGAITT